MNPSASALKADADTRCSESEREAITAEVFLTRAFGRP